jgi:hypothetical protein
VARFVPSSLRVTYLYAYRRHAKTGPKKFVSLNGLCPLPARIVNRCSSHISLERCHGARVRTTDPLTRNYHLSPSHDSTSFREPSKIRSSPCKLASRLVLEPFSIAEVRAGDKEVRFAKFETRVARREASEQPIAWVHLERHFVRGISMVASLLRTVYIFIGID